MRIFLDTNVLVSAFATRGLCADVLREILTSHLLIISAPLLNELEHILKEKIGIPQEFVEEIIELLKRDACFVTSSTLYDIDIKDTDDVVILSSALEGKADLFITGDKEILDLGKVQDMTIVSPRKFWEKLKSITNEK